MSYTSLGVDPAALPPGAPLKPAPSAKQQKELLLYALSEAIDYRCQYGYVTRTLDPEKTATAIQPGKPLESIGPYNAHGIDFPIAAKFSDKGGSNTFVGDWITAKLSQGYGILIKFAVGAEPAVHLLATKDLAKAANFNNLDDLSFVFKEPTKGWAKPEKQGPAKDCLVDEGPNYTMLAAGGAIMLGVLYVAFRK